MTYIYAITGLLAGLGTFLLGVKLLSENMEKLANRKLKALFKKTSNNKLSGVWIGTFSTAIVQSSGLTTVMIIGFVNSGLMSLSQATTFIMGANIGTTITAQLAALESFSFSQIAIVTTFIGIMLNMIAKNGKRKSLGLTFAGIGLVFIGIQLMTDSMEVDEFNKFIEQMFTVVNNPFLLLFIGIILTALFQSSSAVTSIVIAMCGAGVMIGNGGNSALYIILGTNIGSCVTALLSSIGTGSNARRAALIHLLFNTFGSLLFFIMMLIYKGFMDDTFAIWFSGHPATQIAMFHTFFNLVCTALFLPISDIFVKISTFLVKDDKKVVARNTYLDHRFLSAPTVAIEQTKREVFVMASLAIENLRDALNDFIARQIDENKINAKTAEIGQINKQITAYLVELSGAELTYNDERRISVMHSNLSDVMRISEIADNVAKYTKTEVEEELVFSAEVLKQLNQLMEKIESLYTMCKDVVISNKFELLSSIDSLEDEVDAMRKVLINNHIERLKNGECHPANSGIFINLVSNLERAGDHITYIAHSSEEVAIK